MAVSGAFGKFADKREMQTAITCPGDYSRRSELWLDFLSDTGDGWDATFTMAWLLAQKELPGANEIRLPRGDVLVLGGDQVYPSAGREAYQDRFVGPFRSALPLVEPESEAPDLYALPGNHDWYDGLGSFLGLFCQQSFIGGWHTQQQRSYFSLQLPHRWWLWAIDIQFDTFIDTGQLKYFKQQAARLESGDKVLLLTAKPSWVTAEEDRLQPASWANLAYFEREFLAHKDKDVKYVLTLTGDLHHYSRYEPETRGDLLPTRLTAGGGGAYTSPTHTLPTPLKLKRDTEQPAATYRREEVYPCDRQSKRLRWGILSLPIKTPSFGFLMAAVYALLAMTVLIGINGDEMGLVAAAQHGGLGTFVSTATTGTGLLLVLLLIVALAVYADLPFLGKLAVGVPHAVAHVALAVGAVYAMTNCVLATGANGLLAGLATVAATAIVGYALGGFLFAVVLLAIHGIRGEKATKHANEVFAGQAITKYKNFLRLHFDRDGALTVYVLGVDAISEWDYAGKGAAGAPGFKARDGREPSALVIETLEFSSDGDRLPPCGDGAEAALP